MSNDIAFWACIVSVNVYSSVGKNRMAAFWLVIALVALFFKRGWL